MPIGINLLPTRKPVKRWPAERLKVGTIVALVLYVFLTFGLLGYTFLITRQLSQVEAQKAVFESEITKNEKKENLAVLLKDRLSKEEKLLASKVNYKQTFEVVDNLATPDILFEETEISKGELSLSGETTNASSLKNLLERIEGLADDFSFAKILSVSRTKDGSYSFSLESILAF